MQTLVCGVVPRSTGRREERDFNKGQSLWGSAAGPGRTHRRMAPTRQEGAEAFLQLLSPSVSSHSRDLTSPFFSPSHEQDRLTPEAREHPCPRETDAGRIPLVCAMVPTEQPGISGGGDAGNMAGVPTASNGRNNIRVRALQTVELSCVHRFKGLCRCTTAPSGSPERLAFSLWHSLPSHHHPTSGARAWDRGACVQSGTMVPSSPQLASALHHSPP